MHLIVRIMAIIVGSAGTYYVLTANSPVDFNGKLLHFAILSLSFVLIWKVGIEGKK